jgi:hypothetical protein
LAKRLIHGNGIGRLRRATEPIQIGILTLQIAPALRSLFAACVVHQNPPHCLGSISKKVTA